MERCATVLGVLSILLSASFAAGCGSDDSAPASGPWVGLWTPPSTSPDVCGECVRAAYLRVDADTLYAIMNVDECGFDGKSVVSGSFKPDVSQYRVEGDKFYVRLNGTSKESSGLITCSGDTLTITGVGPALGGGTWTRVPEDKGSRVRPLFYGKCEGWDRCYGPGLSNEQCQTGADCLVPPSSKQTPQCDTSKKCSIPIC